MLHNEARKLLMKAWNKTHNTKEAAECFGVNASTVYRLERWDTFIKRSLSMLRDRSDPDVRSKRKAWKSHMSGSGAELPSLSSDDSIIMDDMCSHHAKAVKQVLDAAGIARRSLPFHQLLLPIPWAGFVHAAMCGNLLVCYR